MSPFRLAMPGHESVYLYGASIQEILAFRAQCVALGIALIMTVIAAVFSLRRLWRWRFRIHDPSLKAAPVSTPQILVGLFDGRMLVSGLVALVILGTMFLPARELEVELYWVRRLIYRRQEWWPVEYLGGGIGLMILGLTFYVHRVVQIGIISREYRLITRALFYPVFVFVSLAILIANKATGYFNQLTLIWQFPMWLGLMSLAALHPKMPFWNRENRP